MFGSFQIDTDTYTTNSQSKSQLTRQAPFLCPVPQSIKHKTSNLFTGSVESNKLAISSDGTKLVCAARCLAHVWNLITGHLEGTLDNSPERIECLNFVDHDRKLAVSHGTRVRIWDTGSLLNSEKSPRSKEMSTLVSQAKIAKSS